MSGSDPVQRLRITFSKGGEARFLSHLDLLATLEYAMRRARLPLALAEGFNPRPRMSLAAPLAVGHIGSREILELTLKERREPADVLTDLQKALPAGITLLEIEEFDPAEKSAASRLRAATYRVALAAPVQDLSGRVADLLARDRIDIVEDRHSGPRNRDIRPLIQSIEVQNASTLRIEVSLAGGGSVRPEQVLDVLGASSDGALIIRETLQFEANPSRL